MTKTKTSVTTTPTLQLPRFSLFFFGNLFHVFVVYVVLAHKAIYSSVQKVYSWMRRNSEDILETFWRSWRLHLLLTEILYLLLCAVNMDEVLRKHPKDCSMHHINPLDGNNNDDAAAKTFIFARATILRPLWNVAALRSHRGLNTNAATARRSCVLVDNHHLSTHQLLIAQTDAKIVNEVY